MTLTHSRCIKQSGLWLRLAPAGRCRRTRLVYGKFTARLCQLCLRSHQATKLASLRAAFQPAECGSYFVTPYLCATHLVHAYHTAGVISPWCQVSSLQRIYTVPRARMDRIRALEETLSPARQRSVISVRSLRQEIYNKNRTQSLYPKGHRSELPGLARFARCLEEHR